MTLAQETLSKFISENTSNILIINGDRNGEMAAPIRTPVGPLRMRYEPDVDELVIVAQDLRFGGSMRVGDQISIMLSNRDTFRTTIATLYAIGFMLLENGSRILLEDGSGFLLWEDQTDAGTSIGLTDPLPDGVSIGAPVYDNSAMANPDLH
jgi:hypothetical protein